MQFSVTCKQPLALGTAESDTSMERRSSTVVRKGRIYHFTIDGTDYAAFIWQVKTHFCGRIEGNPHVPECQARTALDVCNALSASLIKAKA